MLKISKGFLGVAVVAAGVSAAGAVHAALPPAEPALCTDKNLSYDVKMLQSDFFRDFTNQDLVAAMNETRRQAKADMAAGRFNECAQKVSVLQAMVANPQLARATWAEYRTAMLTPATPPAPIAVIVPTQPQQIEPSSGMYQTAPQQPAAIIVVPQQVQQ